MIPATEKQTEILSTFNNMRWAVFFGSIRLASHKIYEPSRKIWASDLQVYLGTSSYSPSIVTMAVSLAIAEIFTIKEWLELQIWVVQGHWKWRRSTDHVWLYIGLPL